MDTLWTIELLGGMAATGRNERTTRFATQKTAALLAYLAFYSGKSHLRETLVEALWPETDPAQGRARLSTLLSYLRSLLEPSGTPAGTVVEADRSSVRLNPERLTTDVRQFELLLRKVGRIVSQGRRRETMEESLRVMVIGAGIGGLTTAIALRQAGFTPVLYERAPEIRAIGAGMMLWPNAFKALDYLNLTEPMRPIASRIGVGSIRNSRGEVLIKGLSADAWTRRFGELGKAVHRADLHRVLSEQLADIDLHLGKTLVGFEQQEQRVVARFEDGTEAEGALLVGADGLQSVVRKQLLGDSPLRYSGYTAWRGVVPYHIEALEVSETWGCGQRFGLVPLVGDRVYWFATATRPEGEPDPTGSHKATVRNLFRGWHDPIEAVLDATSDTAVLCHDTYDRPPAPFWSQGRVTLLGDAAHPMTPDLGQGACQAIEDAAVLARSLRGATDLNAALRAYEQRRIPRTSAIVAQSRRVARIGQATNRYACGLRDFLAKRLPEESKNRQLDSLFDFEV